MKRFVLLIALMVCTLKAYQQQVRYTFDAPCTNTACGDNCHGIGDANPFFVDNTVFSSAGTFDLGPGLGGAGGTCGGSPMNGFASGVPGNPSRARWARAWPISAVPNTGDYFSFTLTTNPLDLVQVTQITWRERKSASDGPTGREVRISSDGFATWTTYPVLPNNSTTDIWVTRGMTAGLPTFNGTIEVRIYGFSAASTNGTLRIDNLFVFANVILNNLPVELVGFSGEQKHEQVELSWETASETNNSHFDIFHSEDNEQWQVIGTVLGVGFSTNLQSYGFKHANPSVGVNYYKLMQADFDETEEFSKTISVNFEASSDQLVVSPNPVSPGEPIKSSHKITEIFDSLGRSVKIRDDGSISEPGVYFLMSEGDKTRFCKIVVAH